MVVDYLSSFYQMPCLLTIGGQVVQTAIRWYRAPAGAKPLPFPTTFFSHINDADPGESIPGEMGEVGSPRTWDAGRNAGYQGQCYRGQASWFQTGQLPSLNTIAPSACACQIPPAIAEGGLVLGGTAFPPRVTTCALCPGGSPVAWVVTVAGGTGAFGLFNGTWRLTYQGLCSWLYVPGPGVSFELFYRIGVGPWTVRFILQPTHSAVYGVSGAFACLGPNTWTLVSSAGTGTPPTSVSSAPEM